MAMFDEARVESAKAEVQQIISLLNIRKTDHLLDLCCGNGRHLLEFSRKGYRVTGIDITASYLEDLKGKAKQERLEVTVLKSDARYYSANNTYDAVYNLYASFGYFENESDNVLLLKNIYDSLKPGGKLLVNITEKASTVKNIQPYVCYEIEGMLCGFKQSISDNGQWLQFESTFTINDHTDTIHYKVRLYPVHEICSLLTRVGFKSISCYGSLDGSPHGDASMELFVVAQK